MVITLYLANRPFRVPSHVAVPMKLSRLIYFILPHFLAFRSKKEREKLQPLGSSRAHGILYRKKQL